MAQCGRTLPLKSIVALRTVCLSASCSRNRLCKLASRLESWDRAVSRSCPAESPSRDPPESAWRAPRALRVHRICRRLHRTRTHAEPDVRSQGRHRRGLALSLDGLTYLNIDVRHAAT